MAGQAVSTSGDQTIRVWDVATWNGIRTRRSDTTLDYAQAVAIAPAAPFLVGKLRGVILVHRWSPSRNANEFGAPKSIIAIRRPSFIARVDGTLATNHRPRSSRFVCILIRIRKLI